MLRVGVFDSMYLSIKNVYVVFARSVFCAVSKQAPSTAKNIPQWIYFVVRSLNVQ